MSVSPNSTMTPLPPWVRVPVGLLCGATAIWGLVGAALAVTLPQTSVWTFFGFEIVVALAGVLGLFLALGYYRQAPALALICIAGTILVASFFGHRGSAGVIGTFSLRTWLLARLALGFVLTGLAALTVLTRNRKSWGALFRGVAFGVLPALFAAMFGLASIGYGRPLAPPTPPDQTISGGIPETGGVSVAAAASGRQPAIVDNAVRQFMAIPIFKAQKGGLEAGRVVLLTVLGLLVIGLTSAAVHYVIRAFQLGAFPDPSSGAGRSAPAPAQSAAV